MDKTYKEGILQIGMQKNWQEIIEVNGIGKSYGIEFQLQKNTGNIIFFISGEDNRNADGTLKCDLF